MSHADSYSSRRGDDRMFAPDCEWDGKNALKKMPDWVEKGLDSPSGRSTFATWRHWTKDDALLPSGIIGPVLLREGEIVAMAK